MDPDLKIAASARNDMKFSMSLWFIILGIILKV
jgi:hypothetical protein